LRNAPEFFTKLVNSISQPVLVKDKEHRLVLVNDAFCTFIGRSRQDLLALTCDSFLPEHQADFIRQADMAVLSTGQEHMQEEVWTDAKARIHAVRAKRILHKIEGDKQFIFVILEEEPMARHLQYARGGSEHIQEALDSIGEGIITTDTLGTIKLINLAAQEITGWTADEARGKPLSEVLHFLDAETQKPPSGMIERLLASETRASFPRQLILVARNGANRFIQGTIGPITAKDHRTIGAVLLFRDSTEAQRQETDRLSAEKLDMVAKFAGAVAHDLGNLLTGIGGFIELAQFATPSENTKIRGNLSRAADVLAKTKGLAVRLQTFSKGGPPVRFPTALPALLRQNTEMTLGGRNITWKLIMPDDLWPCEIDDSQISLALHHVLNNARQAMQKGGNILIQARNLTVDKDGKIPLAAGNYVAIEIEDQGSGIPPELGEKIFDPFFTTREKGSGLGLTLARSILTNHFGSIDVKSVQGKGTTVTLFLPAASTKCSSETSPARAEGAKPGRILFMDDEEAVRIATSRLLKNLGYGVETACDADEAAQRYSEAMAKGQPFAAVILDLITEGGGASAALAQLRQIDPQVKAIAASGYTSDPIIRNPEQAGFNAAIRKPYTSADLDIILRSVLNR
jgi:PAS domain S-box-containing protein